MRCRLNVGTLEVGTELAFRDGAACRQVGGNGVVGGVESRKGEGGMEGGEGTRM